MSNKFLPASFLALAALAIGKHHYASAAAPTPNPIAALRAASTPQSTGSFPDNWIAGLDCAGDPQIQVHAYNEDTFILRQSKCDTFEAPFMYLLFGEDLALLLDTGAAPSSPVEATVRNLIRRRASQTGQPPVPLVVGHTHGHFDHIASDSQFMGKSYVAGVVASSGPNATAAYGFSDYPFDSQELDLGGRVLDVLGSPGHFPSEISFYDRNTQLLITGDIVYPGHLFVFSPNAWPDFVASLERLVEFASTHPVQWLVGCHIETSNTPFEPYAYGTLTHPDEHQLQLDPSFLQGVLDAALEQNGDPECTIYDEFVIHPVYKCGITWNG